MKPLRLMCIHGFPYYNNRLRTPQDPKAPEVLEEVTGIEVISLKSMNFYLLAEYAGDEIFDVDCFAILPDPSEEVGIEQQQEAIIYQR